MRWTRILALSVLVGLLPAAAVQAAPGDPYLIYTANSSVDGAVVLRTDPATGATVEISRNGSQGTLFRRPYDLAVEPDGSLLVADMGTPNAKDGAVIRVDPLTGRQSLVASGGQFYDPAGIAVAPNGDILVADNFAPDNDGAVIRVDPRTGAQTLVSTAGQLDLPFGIAVDRDGSLLVTNRVEDGGLPALCPSLGKVVRVNPATGAQSGVAAGGLLSYPLGLAVDADGSIVVANECQGANGLVRLRPPAQSPVTANGAGDLLVTPERVAFDPAGGLLVTDFSLGPDLDGGIARINAGDGLQGLLRQGDLFNHPLGLAVVVNHPPAAALALQPSLVAAGRPVRLDGSASRDPDGQRLVYEWDLDGDGNFEAGSGATAVVSRTWRRDGPHMVRVRVNDPHGGRAVAEGLLNVDGSVPIITRLRADVRILVRRSPQRRRRATTVRFRLSEAARVGMAVRRARRTRRGIIWTRTRLIHRAGRPGDNRLVLRARRLRPGRYRLRLTATDAVGHEAVPRSLGLRVVRAR
jgi:DNA-binding beta-propeller fold protein YncE